MARPPASYPAPASGPYTRIYGRAAVAGVPPCGSSAVLQLRLLRMAAGATGTAPRGAGVRRPGTHARTLSGAAQGCGSCTAPHCRGRRAPGIDLFAPTPDRPLSTLRPAVHHTERRARAVAIVYAVAGAAVGTTLLCPAKLCVAAPAHSPPVRRRPHYGWLHAATATCVAGTTATCVAGT